MEELKQYIIEHNPFLANGAWKQGYKPYGGYDAEIATENLLLFKKISDKYDIEFWLSFGTLLGVYRDGKLIDYDHDIDISIRTSESNKFILADKELIENGFEPVRVEVRSPLISWGRKGTYLDVYGFSKRDDVTWSMAHYLIPDDQIKEFEYIEFEGEFFNTPKDVEKYLSTHYGNWRVPAPGITATQPKERK